MIDQARAAVTVAVAAYREAIDVRDPVAFQRSLTELQVAQRQLARLEARR